MDALNTVLPDGLYDLGSQGYHTYPPGSTLWSPRVDSYPQQDMPPHPRLSEARDIPGERPPEVPDHATEWPEEEDDLGERPTDRHADQSQKQSQVAATLKWLSENYERAEGVCLPRCVLYTHYLDFCKKMKFTPSRCCNIREIIRQKFPKLTTRRLGTRGQSKYHYYGIGIKETSIYYHSVYSGKGLTRFSGIKIKTEGSNRKYSLSSKTGTLLPEFPDANNLILPEDIDREKMETFIMMYRTHCQRILDTVISANFDEVQNFLLHFWQGMPEHLVEVLKAEVLADVIALCDSILYKVLVDVLIPSSIQDLPDSLGSEIKVFVKRLPVWLESSLENAPKDIQDRKQEVARGFVLSVRRQVSFVHLAQTARSVLVNHDCVCVMQEDLADLDIDELCCQVGYHDPERALAHRDAILENFDEFQNLLGKQAPIEAYTEWMDNIIDKCVLQPCREKKCALALVSSEFLLNWALIGSLVMRDLTLNSASSFGSFHLIHMMLDEYVFLVMETQNEMSRETQLQKSVQKHMKNAEEIKMHAKVRTSSNKSQNSPKNRKRKHTEDHYDSNSDEHDTNPITDENRPSHPHIGSYEPLNGTAFSRPTPSAVARETSFALHEDATRGNFNHASLPLSPIKHYSSFNGTSYDRPSYLPQFGLNSYSDYVTHNNAFTSTRVQTYPDSHAHAQTFPSVPIASGLAHSPGSYWSESRTHPAFTTDPYGQYNYNNIAPAYDSYKKGSLIRGSVYQESFNRSAFDSARGYYSRPQDNFQVGSSLPVGSYGGNFMEIAPTGGQYSRQESVVYQDDMYSTGTGFSSFGKTYLTAAPFR
ncbi:DNA-binding protein RFX6-like [Haliotis rufescens]|uniref:DNA-binding protein RFX6-like n=1 Tax=Haliotis rufescens TaxID=6454 RepID=UPI00201E7D4A|nr:DNA-binding protein RFX6-like [Haliotis rufescens]